MTDANWDDLRVFLTLAREGTLTTAAKALGVSHPTVARRVQALEKQIGARLFERLPDRFAPTSAGEQLLADTEAMEKAALSIHRRSAGLDYGVIRVFSIKGFARLCNVGVFFDIILLRIIVFCLVFFPVFA